MSDGVVRSMLMIRIMMAILMNYKIVSFPNWPIVSSFTVWFFSILTLMVSTIDAITLIPTTTSDVPIMADYWNP